jgi:adenosylcobinamide-phosphate synthase
MLFALIISLLIDLFLKEPPLIIHPVVWVGKISERLIKPYASKAYGILLWMISVVPVLMILTLPLVLFSNIIIQLVISIFIIKISFSIKLLYDIVNNARRLDESSRYWIQQIVRRDVYKLDKGHLASAAIESLFESAVDGITSPLFWYIILGPFGCLLQRLSNTMDSMVGYKTPELIKEGWFSARVDTILNFIPARITGLLMILLGGLMKYNWRNAIISLKNAKMESINAKYPISIIAGLLEVKLEKIGYYSVGFGELPNEKHLAAAIRFFKILIITYITFILIIDYYLYGLTLFNYPYGLIELLYFKFVSY